MRKTRHVTPTAICALLGFHPTHHTSKLCSALRPLRPLARQYVHLTCSPVALVLHVRGAWRAWLGGLLLGLLACPGYPQSQTLWHVYFERV